MGVQPAPECPDCEGEDKKRVLTRIRLACDVRRPVEYRDAPGRRRAKVGRRTETIRPQAVRVECVRGHWHDYGCDYPELKP